MDERVEKTSAAENQHGIAAFFDSRLEVERIV
jgi:hypothetical protein